MGTDRVGSGRGVQSAEPAGGGAGEGDPRAGAPVLSTVTDDLVGAVLGLEISVALYLDGRAHVLGLPDSFFTPWHGLVYGGLLLLGGWIAVVSRRAAVRHRLGVVARIPAGYGFAAAGAVLFAIGGAGDLAWHQIFGIEADLDALLSPSHLWLFVAGSLLMSGPILAARRRAGPASFGVKLTVTLAVTSITAIWAFAVSFTSGFLTDPESFTVGGAAQVPEGSFTVVGLSGYLVSSFVLVVPVVYLIRARLAFFGTVTVLVTSLALLASLLEDFHDPRVVLAALAAAAVTDAALVTLDRRGSRARARELVAAALIPLLVWPGQLLVKNLGQGVAWSVELVNGVVILSALLVFAAVLALGPGPSRQAR
ncbi:hypothetical protein [Cryobacterium fucosi]|uniref:Uncharacterized protein n=1 Tax=Cryobacterium fucosi TaxID=1259157 RepID=A0A4R9BFT3_9MICO|nr:hypothetical protein [Cryobacterium fucosi]TFD83353.1 hypothetical protein E3T48_00360 [Cryobacterium fucosi]